MKNKRNNHSRTPLFASLRRALMEALYGSQQDLSEQRRKTMRQHREFLRTSAAAMLSITGASVLGGWKSERNEPRIAIVGAGIAGLNVAYKLQKAGCKATVYEAAERVGGRIYSKTGILDDSLTTEFGGEFINSEHEEMLALAREFGLELYDLESASEKWLNSEGYFFNGQFYSEEQVVSELAPFAKQMKAVNDEFDDIIDYKNPGGAEQLDRLSISEYMEKLGIQGWLRELLEVTYTTEYGLDASEQSCLNMIFMIPLEPQKQFPRMIDDSDERYKVKGGNQRIVDEMARRLDEQIHLGHRLQAIKSKGRGFSLHFTEPNGAAKQVDADFVVLCIPFTTLRHVEIAVELPAVKKKAIAELGYGTNAKVMMGFTDRAWRKAGYTGKIYSDEPFQLLWANSQMQPGKAGGLTAYSGGKQGVEIGVGTAISQACRLLPGIAKVFPGIDTLYNGKCARQHWPSYEFAQGSYSCYKPRQWTTIAGAEIEPVGNLFFAGEHCSYDYQGYMNGAADTGKTTAMALLKTVKG